MMAVLGLPLSFPLVIVVMCYYMNVCVRVIEVKLINQKQNEIQRYRCDTDQKRVELVSIQSATKFIVHFVMIGVIQKISFDTILCGMD